LKIIINRPTKLTLRIKNQALIFSTTNLPGIEQMALDLNSKQISGANIISDYRGVAFANYNGKCF